jgi:hypothetical protein
MLMLKTKSSGLSTKIRAWSSFVVLGVLLIGCQPNGPSSSAHPSATTPPSCDTTVPLNHCGAYMPQYNPNNHS